jgi:hypothetical protein
MVAAARGSTGTASISRGGRIRLGFRSPASRQGGSGGFVGSGGGLQGGGQAGQGGVAGRMPGALQQGLGAPDEPGDGRPQLGAGGAEPPDRVRPVMILRLLALRAVVLVAGPRHRVKGITRHRAEA